MRKNLISNEILSDLVLHLQAELQRAPVLEAQLERAGAEMAEMRGELAWGINAAAIESTNLRDDDTL